MEYKMLSSNNPEGLSVKIQKYLDDGWELYGSPCMACDSSENFYAQAMVLKENEQ